MLFRALRGFFLIPEQPEFQGWLFRRQVEIQSEKANP